MAQEVPGSPEFPPNSKTQVGQQDLESLSLVFKAQAAKSLVP